MSSFLNVLLTAAPGHTLFIDTDRAPITAGQIRAGAARLAREIPISDAPLFLYTASASELCAGILAAKHLGRTPVLLPQAGAEYCDQVGAYDHLLAGDAASAGTEICLGTPGSDAKIAIDPAVFSLTFFTSGSSGDAKAIDKPMRIIDAEAEYWRDWFAGRIDHVTGSVSHQHIYGLLFRIVLPVISSTPSSDKSALSWEALLATRSSKMLVVSSPAHLSRPPSASYAIGHRPAFILSSGGPLPESAANIVAEMFGTTPVEILGSTETGGVAMRQRQGKDDWWTPLAVTKVRAGEDQELMVSSPFMTDPGFMQMGDRVEFGADGRFRLTGRLDRIVKVEGKRVSLTRVENALKQHPELVDAAVIMTDHNERPQLSAVVTLNETAQHQLGKLGAFRMARRIASDLAETLEPAERPKRWRFVSAIPVNSQSKRTQANLAKLFESERILTLLAPDSMEVGDFTARLEFVARQDLPWFQGHFKGMPVLPGVSQVHIAVRLAEEIWAVAPASMQVSRLKFHRPVTPDEIITLNLSYRPQAKKLEFAFSHCNARVSTGTVG